VLIGLQSGRTHDGSRLSEAGLSVHRAQRRRSRLGAVVATLLVALVIVGGAAAGFMLAGIPSAFAESPPPSAAVAPTPVLPAQDAAGDDLATLPRYPASVRTSYQQEVQGTTVVTAVAYVTDAELDDVRGFYRRIFRELGWEVAELDFSLTQWVFVISSGAETALVVLTNSGGTVTIELELEQPQETEPSTAPAAPLPPAPPPPPPGDGDDDDLDD
jgi:hypothetical protein